MPVDDLTASVELPVSQQRAFTIFVHEFSSWWPPEFSWSGAKLLVDVGIDARVGGALYEIGPHELRWDFGLVTSLDEPRSLGFTWQIGPDRAPVPDPNQATEVLVSMASLESGGCRVDVVHRGWDRHGQHAATYRENFQQAWPYALQRLVDHAG